MKLFRVTRQFFIRHFGFVEPSDFETWSLVLLLNPAKGIIESKKKDKLLRPACDELYACLGDAGVEIFRDIFSNNNRTLITRFFSNKIIRQLWGYLRVHLTFEHCFKRSDPRSNILMTYVYITRTLIDQFDLIPPDWWLVRFNYDTAR